MTGGWTGSFDKLEGILEAMSTKVESPAFAGPS